MALALDNLWFWVLLLALGGGFYALARWLAVPLVPAFVMRLGLLLILLLGAFWPSSAQGGSAAHKEILILDLRQNVDVAAHQAAVQAAIDWLAGAENRFVFAVGTQAQAAALPELDFAGRADNLAEVLAQVGQTFGDGVGRVIVASNGIPIGGADVEAQLQQLAARGYTVDFLPLDAYAGENDLYVTRLWTPSSAVVGIPLAPVVTFYAPRAGAASVRWLVNGEVVLTEDIPVQEGRNQQSLSITPHTAGITTAQVSVTWENDPRQENNVGYAALAVWAQPRVLMITQNLETAGRLRDALGRQGIQVSFAIPGDIPVEVSALEPYQAVIVHNILAKDISAAQMAALEAFTADLGRGLIFLGGRNSYTLGGYQGTLLAEVLPLEMTPPTRAERPPLGLLLVLDRSGSMAQAETGAPLPIDLAREAAIRAVETLESDDYLGVLTYAGTPSWDVPLAQLGDGLNLRLVQDAISQVNAGGGTNMYQALDQALDSFLGLRTVETRHVILLSDGISYDGTPETFRELAAFARQQGITLSVISLGEETDRALLAAIAEAGEGRLLEVTDPADLPRIMVSESQAARGDNVAQGTSGLALGEGAHPMLAGLSLEQLPTVRGHNALAPKPDAEIVLQDAESGDPLLAVWQLGLGRVAAWTSDIGEDWLGGWADQTLAGKFWAQVIAYTLPDPVSGRVQTTVEITPDGIVVNTHLAALDGTPLNAATVQFQYADAAGAHTYAMLQVAPGQYRATIPALPPGSYRGLVAYTFPDDVGEVPVPLAIPYPADWQPVDPQAGVRNLENWAELVAGELIAWTDLLTAPVIAQAPAPDWRWLPVLLLVLSWPLEIAVRRRWLPWV
ncbi:MAG: VWA domain-containing protein [Anaerolineales bacterium]|nr:VWA domain-containing protein [Anaerolineales bacterium]